MSGASSVLPISQVGHQALGFTTGDDLVWQRDKRGDARGRRSWGSSLLDDPSAKSVLTMRRVVASSTTASQSYRPWSRVRLYIVSR
jgi:hypothetical protein